METGTGREGAPPRRGIAAWPLSARLPAYVLLQVLAHALGYALRFPDEALTTFWPPAGVALAILAIEPRRLWSLHLAWFVVLDTVMTLYVHGSSAPSAWALYFAGVNAAETLAAAWVLARTGLLPLDCSRVWSYAGFAATASFAVPLLSALAGAAGVAHLTDQAFGAAWMQWWLGDALGILILVPAVHGFLKGMTPLWPRARPGREAVWFVALLALAAVLTGRLVTTWTGSVIHLQHVAVPFLLWAALRFDWRAVAWTLVAVGALLVAEAHVERGPWGDAEASPVLVVHSVQLFLAAVGVPSMLLAAFVVGLRDRHAALVEEMTARELSESGRLELERALQAAQRAEVVADLSAGVAHDVNNMLTVLSGHTEILRRLNAGEPRAQESLEALESAAGHASELTTSLMTLARREPTAWERVDLAEVLRAALPLVERTAPRGVRVSLREPGEPVPVLGDAAQLRQVLVNLCLNAGDAMRERGGALRISLGLRGTDPHRTCVLEVADDGDGMSEATRRRVFDPFFTTKGGGTGLGLAVVRSIAKDHGGDVTVRSAPGRGSTFAVVLPLLDRSLGAADDVPRGRGEIVVVLAADEAFGDRARRALARHGFEALEVHGRSRFLDLLSEDAVFADAYVLELATDDEVERALEPLRRLRAAGDTAPAVLVAAELPAIVRASVELDAALVPRPCSPTDLAAAVRDRLRAAEPRGSAGTTSGHGALRRPER